MTVQEDARKGEADLPQHIEEHDGIKKNIKRSVKGVHRSNNQAGWTVLS